MPFKLDMNLIIDVGNTNVKIAVFENGVCLEKHTVQNSAMVSRVKTLLGKHPTINKGIIASVARLDLLQIDSLKTLLDFTLELSHTTTLPYKNLYKTPKTLGVDRLALVSAAVRRYPNTNVLVVDAGTCITYDFVNDQSEYLGGAISPGMGLRYKALNALTANLPLLEPKAPLNLTGESTETAIHSGVVYGIAKEIDGVIAEYRDIHKDLTVIFTGGDANFLSKQLKSSIFANPNFLLEGLNFILDYNSN